ncbi:MAG: hypothetical protein ACXWWV_02030 [Candidatus Deferrimicrobiaceae bacterium]
MAIQISGKKKFIVNGKEYDSVEGMPDEIRAAYEKEIKSSPGQDHAGTLEMEKSTLVFNGKEYESEEAMPQEERELYKVVMKTMEKEGISIPSGMDTNTGVPPPDMQIPDVSGKPIESESSFSPRKLFSFTAILVLLLGVTYLLFVSGG